ncbi:hypothetical protein TWF481_001707 [Arthrobotrys musiformis]|uniref:F-box domain-containing protein n=1 Tax=Arthrobotrys musiformis TaxID=47236 RepID=A0AAV9VU30_9PEZI
MAPLLTVGSIPELFYEILDHLDPKDTVSLLLTSKVFLPTCNQKLWSNLRLYHTEDETDNESVCYKIVRTLRSNRSILENVRKLTLHRNSLMKDNGFLKSGLIGKINESFASGHLDPSCVELSLTGRMPYNFNWYEDEDVYNTATARLLDRLNAHSERKPNDFSLILWVPLTPNILPTWGRLDTSRVTEMHVMMDRMADDIGDDSSYRAGNLEEYVPDVSHTNFELSSTLVQLLRGVPNLERLYIFTSRGYERVKRYYEDLGTSESLEEVQDAFSSLSKLHTLSIKGKFFHPSLFVAPPDSTRKVVYEGLLSDKWFKKFCQCRFVNVTDLTVNYMSVDWNKHETDWCQEDFQLSTTSVKDVAFTGLQKCKLEFVYDPEEYSDTLWRSILRKNRDLNESSKNRISRDILRRLKEKTVMFPDIASRSYIAISRHWLADTLGCFLNDYAQHSEVQKCVRGCLDSRKDTGDWESAKSEAQTAVEESQSKINSLIKMVAPQIVEKYAKQHMNEGTEFNADQIMKELLQKAMQLVEDRGAWDAEQASKAS